jgi:hypothetical protein
LPTASINWITTRISIAYITEAVTITPSTNPQALGHSRHTNVKGAQIEAARG